MPAKFSVDTNLFRELGELLVGRDSTALIELVKNSYDADATQVTVWGENLGDPKRGRIRIVDNGVGMDAKTFEEGFLRIAARIKNAGVRKSPKLKRRFTGAKGIGRLAAHKLARRISVLSVPWDPSGEGDEGVEGSIDWDLVEEAETLDEVAEEAVVVKPWRPRRGGASGTTLTLSNLRTKWTSSQRTRFFTEVESLRAPRAISGELPNSVLAKRGLFDSPVVVDAKSTDPGFELVLNGEFEVGDVYWETLIEAASWVLEIDAAPTGIRYFVAPTLDTKARNPVAERKTFGEDHPDPEGGPFFHARVLIREGGIAGSKEERTWASRLSGIRVYMEGFRVLPYGDITDDWLFLGHDTQDRTRKLRFLNDSSLASNVPEIEDEGLSLLPNKHYFGGVFLTVDRAAKLQMLVNREGFVPDVAFETIVKIMRRGVDLSTRIRAAATVEQRAARRVERSSGARSEPASVKHAMARLASHVDDLRGIAAAAPRDVATRIENAAQQALAAVELTKEAMPVHSMVLVLASVGTQLASFTHEVNRLLGQAGDVESICRELRAARSAEEAKRLTNDLASAVGDLRRDLERQAAYLVDIMTPDARRRRARLQIAATLDSAWRLVASAADRRQISFQNQVPPDLRTPPMFRSELIAIFSNLLTNAVKAAGVKGRIQAAGEIGPDQGSRIRLENTGTRVDPDSGEHWFRPFESTTVSTDPVLGQGMGLGLSITRDLLGEANAHIAFVAPTKGYAAAVQILFPRAER